MNNLSKKLLLIALFLSFPGYLLPAAAEDPRAEMPETGSESRWTKYTETRAEMIPLIWEEMQDNGIMALSIALVDGQEVVWARGFGYANLAEGDWATESTIYRIGSNSKTITGLSVMKVEEEGLVDIDNSLTDYLPEFSLHTSLRPGPAPSGPITLRTMLTHHSGIPGDIPIDFWSRRSDPDGYADWALDTYLPGEYAAFPANFCWAYSNTAIDFLGLVVGAVAYPGLTRMEGFKEYTDEVFALLGMANSSFFEDTAKPFILENLATGYDADGEYEYFYCNVPPAGSILSNVLDMAKYIKMIHGDGRAETGQWVVQSETLAKMFVRQNGSVPLDFDLRMGLIWVLSDRELDYAGRHCWHNGATPVFRSHLEILLDQKLGVVLISNTAMAGSALPVLAKEALKLALEEKTGLAPVPVPTPLFSPVASWSQQSLEALAGIYVTQSGYDILEAVTDGLLWRQNAWSDEAESSVVLVPRENGWFSESDSQLLQVELGEVSGRSVMAQHQYNSDLRTIATLAERYELSSPIPAAWRNRAGFYRSIDLSRDDYTWFTGDDNTLEIRVEEGMVVIDSSFFLVIEPLTDDLGVIRGLGRDKGTSVQAVTVDGREEIRFMGFSFVKLNSLVESGDYDGDGISDIAVFRPDTGLWAVRGLTRIYYGTDEDVPVSGDYDGDGTTDLAVCRRVISPPLWAVRNVTRLYFGEPWDQPVPADYDGDGSCDIAAFDVEAGLWKVRDTTRLYFGAANDYPAPADYNGDGTSDIAVFRPSTGLWSVRGVSRYYFGSSLDLPIPADYDGDGTTEVSVFRPSTGLWALRSITRRYFGSSADQPIPADYAGGGVNSVGIFRESTGLWAVRDVTRVYYGEQGDVPLAK